MDAELRQRFPAELHQIRAWLDEFIEDELQVGPEFERSILQAERDPVVELGGRVQIWKPVSLWANVDGGSFDANSESAFELRRQDGQSLKRPHQARIGATKAALNFNSPGGMDPARLAVSQVQFCFGRFYQ